MRYPGLVAALSAVSALAAPASPPRQDSPLAAVMQLVAGLKSTVQNEFASLSSVDGITTEMIPLVQQILGTVVGEVQGITGQLAPMVLGIAMPLAREDVSGVMVVVADSKDIVTNIKTNIESMIGGLSSEAVAAVQPEISQVMAVASPLVSPIMSLVMGAASTTTPGSAGIDNLLVLAGELQTLVGGLTAPVSGLLVPLLGGVAGGVL